MEEAKINIMEVHRDLSLENKVVLLPEVNRQIIIQNFPPRRQQHAHFNEGHNRRYSPPHSLHQHSTIPWPVMLLVDQ